MVPSGLTIRMSRSVVTFPTGSSQPSATRMKPPLGTVPVKQLRVSVPAPGSKSRPPPLSRYWLS